jgi:hypothetical protein
MTDEFEQELRGELARAVPDPPEDLGRAAAARRMAHRHRRRRTGLAAVVAATAAVVAVVAVPSILGQRDRSGSGVTVTEDSESTPTTSLGEEGYQCPHGDEPRPLVSPSTELPGGAVRARICAADPSAWTAPADALEVPIDELVVLINSADPVPSDAVCPAVVGDAFTMTFQYDDGRTFGIRGDTGGCDTIVVGGEERYGASELVDIYAELLAEQRAEREPSASPGIDPQCPSQGEVDAWQTILFDDMRLDLVVAIACEYTQGALPREVALDEATLAAINDDITAHVSGDVPYVCEYSGPSYEIRGADSWGDPYLLVGECGLGYFSYQGRYWEPSPEVQDMLTALFR